MCARASWRLAPFRHLSEYLESLHRCESTMPAKKGCLHVKKPRHPVPLPANYFFKLDTETRAPPTQTRPEACKYCSAREISWLPRAIHNPILA